LEGITAGKGLSVPSIQMIIKNAAGTKPALFIPDRAFEVLAQKQIKKLRLPSLNVAESICNEMSRVLTEVKEKDIGRFFRLREAVLEIGNELLRKKLKEAQQLINTTIDIELSYINTNHPDFVGMKMNYFNGSDDKESTAENFLNRLQSRRVGVFSVCFIQLPQKNPKMNHNMEKL